MRAGMGNGWNAGRAVGLAGAGAEAPAAGCGRRHAGCVRPPVRGRVVRGMRAGRNVASGFTLAELMVAMGIASLLMLVLLALAGQGSRGFHDTQRRVNTQSESRAVLHFLGREVSTRLPGTPLRMKEGEGDLGDPGHDKAAIFRVLEEPERALDPDGGDVTLVVWQVLFTEDRAGRVSPKLYRKLVPTRESQDLMRQGFGLPEVPEVDPAKDEVLAYNVVSFRARLWKQAEDGSLTEWQESDGRDPAAVPVALDLELGIIDDTTAGRLTGEADWRGETELGARAVGRPGEPRSGEAVRRFATRISLES